MDIEEGVTVDLDEKGNITIALISRSGNNWCCGHQSNSDAGDGVD